MGADRFMNRSPGRNGNPGISLRSFATTILCNDQCNVGKHFRLVPDEAQETNDGLLQLVVNCKRGDLS